MAVTPGTPMKVLAAVLAGCFCILVATMLIMQNRVIDIRQEHSSMSSELAMARSRLDTLGAVASGFLEREDSLGRMTFVADSLRARLEERELMETYQGYYLTIDTYQNRYHLRLRTSAGEDMLIRSGYCGTGKGWTYNDLGQAWDFSTPRGVRYVLRTGENPYWYRPDWYWQEMNLRPPDPDQVVLIPDTLSWDQQIAYYNDSLSAQERIWVRAVPGALGSYKLDLGGGLLIHYGVGRGNNVSHGCIRVSSSDLEVLYRTMPLGAPVVIY